MRRSPTIGPREAVQPTSAFCRICDTALSALPLKLRGVARSAASRIADNAIATGAITKEAREAGGSGGNSTCASFGKVARGDSQSMAFRLMKNDTAITAIAIRPAVRRNVRPSLSRNGSCIIPPD